MRPTLGNYFEVEPGSGISFLKKSIFFDNFYVRINQQASQQNNVLLHNLLQGKIISFDRS